MSHAKCFGVSFALLVASQAAFAAEPAKADLPKPERSYVVHASLGLAAQKGYDGPDFPAVPPPTEDDVKNAARMLADQYAANRLYLLYHGEMPAEDARRVFKWWRAAAPESVELVPALVLKMCDEAKTPVFDAPAINGLAEFFKKEAGATRVALYDVQAKRDQGPGLAILADAFPGGLVRLGLQPDEPIAAPYTEGVEDTGSALALGKRTDMDWLQPGFGADLLRRRVQDRDPGSIPIAWNLATVAWDYSATPRGVYPGYDNPDKNMAIPTMRNRMAAKMIITTAYRKRFAGYSSDLRKLQENSRSAAHDGPADSFYQRLRAGRKYSGYYSTPLTDIVTVYRQLTASRSEP